MSVRITESEHKTTGQGWQVSRRAFLAQTSALLIAMGVPAKRAAALAGQMYQTKEQCLAGEGYVQELVMALSSKVSDQIDPSGAASVQLLVKKLYEDAGLASFDAIVGMEDYVTGPQAEQTIRAVMGAQGADASAAAVFGNVIITDAIRSMGYGLATAKSKLGSSLPEALAKVLNGGLSTASLTEGVAASEPLYVYQDPERALLERMTAALHESNTRIEAKVPNGKVSVGITESASKLHTEVLNVVVSNWLEAQYDDAEFAEARELAQAMLAKSDLALPAADALAKTSLAFAGSSKDLVNAGLSKVRALINDPEALHGALESELNASQTELDEVLGKLDALSRELSEQNVQFAEDVPGTRYILADVQGLGDKVAVQRVEELNRLSDRAGELSKKVIDLQFQMEDLNVHASDGRAVEEKLLALEHRLVEASATLEQAIAGIQKSAGITTDANAEALKTQMAAAVEEAYGLLERNKDLARADVSPVDWAVQKAAAANLLVQSAQMAAVLTEGLQLKGGESALAESFKMFGLWNENMPIDGLEALCKEQLALRTDKALANVTAFADAVQKEFTASLATLSDAGWSKYIAHVITAALAQVDPRLETTVAALGLSADSTVEQLAEVLKSELPEAMELKSMQENVFVAGVCGIFAEAVLGAAAKDPALAESIAKLTPAEVVGGNIHVLAFQTLAAYAEKPVEGAITNYLRTLVTNAFAGDAPVSLAAYADVDAAKVEALMASAKTKQLVVASAKQPISDAGYGLVGLLVPNLLAGFSNFSRDLVVRQAKNTLKVDIH